MEIANRFLIPVTENSQVGEARRRATRLAESMGFGEVETGQISIATTELATNLVKHTQSGGNLIIQLIEPGIFEIVSLNKSPGMSNPEHWLQDGYSTANTLGTGLGAVRRLSSRFDLYSDSETGTAVVARFTSEERTECRFDVGVINLPKEAEPVCGDSWSCVQDGSRLSLMVADGLGHGIEAAEASIKATDIFREDPFLSPAEQLERLHKALRGTRGAAVSIMQIDQQQGKVTFGGLGNVSAAIEFEDKRRHLLPDAGTVGYEARKFRQMDMDWQRGAVAIMHSDGLASAWNMQNYNLLRRRSSPVIAGVLYRDFFKRHDDVTVAVIKNVIGS